MCNSRRIASKEELRRDRTLLKRERNWTPRASRIPMLRSNERNLNTLSPSSSVSRPRSSAWRQSRSRLSLRSSQLDFHQGFCNAARISPPQKGVQRKLISKSVSPGQRTFPRSRLTERQASRARMAQTGLLGRRGSWLLVHPSRKLYSTQADVALPLNPHVQTMTAPSRPIVRLR